MGENIASILEDHGGAIGRAIAKGMVTAVWKVPYGAGKAFAGPEAMRRRGRAQHQVRMEIGLSGETGVSGNEFVRRTNERIEEMKKIERELANPTVAPAPVLPKPAPQVDGPRWGNPLSYEEQDRASGYVSQWNTTYGPLEVKIVNPEALTAQ